jgi:Dolichyl-phosphate-mannose-protein mannosyltransferase
MTTVAPDARGRTGARTQMALACWACWTLVVVERYYLQLWRSLRHPVEFAALLRDATRQALYCAVIAGAAVLVGTAIVTIWLALRRRTAERTRAAALLAAAPLALLWFRAQGAFAASLSSARLPHLPAFGEAAARAGSGVIGAAFVVVASWAAGQVVLRALGLAHEDRDERGILSVTLGFGALAACSAALAWAGIYRPWTVALVIAAFVAGGAIARTAPDGAATAFTRPAGMDTAWLAISFLALSFAFVGALAPETEYDALWYHLDFARRWLDAGGPVDLVQEYPSLYPMTWELVFGAGLAMGGTIAAKLLHFSCLLVLAVTVSLTCRRYLPRCSPWVSVGLLVTAPTMLWEASTAYVDLAVAMFVAIACYALARFAETDRFAWLGASAIEFGLAASTKHLGLVAAAAAVAVLAWDRRRRHLPLAGPLVTLGVVAIVLPLPWYLRAWHGSGNPFFPELYGLFGGGPSTRWDAVADRGLAAFKAHFGFGHGARALARLPWDVTLHAAAFGGTFGPLWAVLVPGWLIGSRGGRAAAVLAAGTLAYVAVWASPVGSLQLRFLVPVGGALALLAAGGWSRVISDACGVAVVLRRGAAIALLALACLNLPPFMALHEADRVEYQGWLTHVLRTAPVAVVIGRESEAQYLARVVPSYPVWQYANANLPAGAAVLTFSGGDNLYSRRTRFSYDSVLARPAVWTAASDDDVYLALRRLGISYVIFDRRLLPQLQSSQLPIAGAGVQRACTTLYEDRRYRLCRLAFVSDASTGRSSPLPGSLP